MLIIKTFIAHFRQETSLTTIEESGKAQSLSVAGICGA